jgi:hypothetical protein
VRKCLYTDAERALVRELYADTPTAEIAKRLGRETCSVYRIASSMGLRKSPEYLAGPNACRLRRGDGVGSGTRFKPGQVPANKGTRRPGWAPGRMAETQFKKGVRTGIAAKNWRPVGTILTDADGYLRIKILRQCTHLAAHAAPRVGAAQGAHSCRPRNRFQRWRPVQRGDRQPRLHIAQIPDAAQHRPQLPERVGRDYSTLGSPEAPSEET